jgi:two-component system nitrogen regulation response regulator GlnG
MNEAVPITDPSIPHILIIDDDAEIRYSLHRVLSRREYRVSAASSGEEGIEAVRQDKPDVIFLDNRMEGMSGLEALQHLRNLSPHSMVILMTAYGTTQTAIEAMKYGAFDYIIKPFNIKKVLTLAENAIKAHRDLSAAEGDYNPLLNSEDYQDGMVGISEKMQDVFKTIGQVAANDFTVLITGESGTGKELVARCIYRHSHLDGKAFMAVNCAAIPENLIESELFGHEKGSFTGATNQRLGTFELCDGGTVFLDEIGDMSLSTQTKILRALQEGEIQRVGGSKIIKVKVRMIAATNKDLESMVAEKQFREDLYYRLNVVRIRLPSLRERMDDIPQLIDYMIQKMAKKGRSRVKKVSAEATALLCSYPWPGNVRELENVIQRASVVTQGETILVKDLPQEIRDYHRPVEIDLVGDSDLDGEDLDAAEMLGSAPVKTSVRVEKEVHRAENASTPVVVVASIKEPIVEDLGMSGPMKLEELYDLLYAMMRERPEGGMLQEIEKELMSRALKDTRGNQVKTAHLLGITRATLRKRIDQLSLRY